MRQFDIVRLTGKELCIVLQHDLLADRRTRVVAPLLRHSAVIATPRLHPRLRLGRPEYFIATEQIGAVEVSEIERVVGSAEDLQYEIRRALDVVFSGV